MTRKVQLMTPIGPSCRRLCVAADAVGYGRGGDYLQLAIQRHLIEVLNEAAGKAGLSRVTWDRQPSGDAELAVLPADEPESVVVDEFVRQLDAALARHNRPLRPEAWLRLRVAVHFGPVMAGDNGFAGPGPVAVSRLVNSEPLRAAMVQAPEANLALLVSGDIYRDTIEPQHTTLRPADFRKVHVTAKEFDADAWLWIPGYVGARST
jgi:class 3 adenylate cyclase